MRHDWIIDVLTDLKTFAQANALDAYAMGVAPVINRPRRAPLCPR